MEPTLQAYLIGVLSGLLLFAGAAVVYANTGSRR